MRIALLGQNCRFGGAREVARGIMTNSVALLPEHTFLLVIPKGYDYPSFSDFTNVEILECPSFSPLPRLRWERRVLAPALQEFQPDWTWALGNNPRAVPTGKQSVLVHRPQLFNYPKKLFAYTWRNWLKETLINSVLRSIMRKHLGRIDRVYCQTQVLRKRFHDTYGYPMEQIGLCPATSCIPEPSENDSTVEQALKDTKGMFRLFYASSPNTHKNHMAIINMFARYREQLADVVCYFTVGGLEVGVEAPIVNGVRRHRLDANIKFTGWIDPSDLPHYYSRMDAVLYPSLIETFGIGQLEAMQYGLPIIVSDTDWAREICGDAAHYVDPFSCESIRDGILLLRNNPELRTQLSEKATRRVPEKLVTWEEIVRNVLQDEGFLKA